jgi:hypothetical protein
VAAERRPGERVEKFDRVRKPAGGSAAGRDARGKEALYSTAPGAEPSAQVLVACTRCDVESGINVLELARALTPPVAWNPLTRKVWARCPSCERRSWLRVRKGQALRALLDRKVTR